MYSNSGQKGGTITQKNAEEQTDDKSISACVDLRRETEIDRKFYRQIEREGHRFVDKQMDRNRQREGHRSVDKQMDRN